jgi:hypothetical protein
MTNSIDDNELTGLCCKHYLQYRHKESYENEYGYPPHDQRDDLVGHSTRAGASVGRRNSGQGLFDVLTTTGPRWLVALFALDFVAHVGK